MANCLYCGQEAGRAGYHETCVPGHGAPSVTYSLPATRPEGRRAGRASSKRIAVAVTGSAIVLIGAVAVVVPRVPAKAIASAPVEPSADTQRYAAYRACMRRGETLLRAPSTARWEGFRDAYTSVQSDKRILVQVEVDAQNAFGTMIRTTVECYVTRTGDFYVANSVRSWGR